VRLGIATPRNTFHERLAACGRMGDPRRRRGKQGVDEVRLPPLQFGLRERPELHDLDPPCQRLCNLRDLEHVGRAREQELPRTRVPVDQVLDLEEEVRNTLDFVDQHRTSEAGDEPGRVCRGCFARGRVVQTEHVGGVLVLCDLSR
jgi:hypothetical protein